MTRVAKRAQQLHTDSALEGKGSGHRIGKEIKQLLQRLSLLETLVDEGVDFAQLNADLPRLTIDTPTATPYQLKLEQTGTVVDDVATAVPTGVLLPASSGLTHVRRKQACPHFYFLNTSAQAMTIGLEDPTNDTIEVFEGAGGVTSYVINQDNEFVHFALIDNRWRAISPTLRIAGRLERSSTQAIANATEVYIDWNSEVYDPYGFHDNGVNPSRITVPTGFAGIYHVSAGVQFGPDADAGIRALVIRHFNSGGTLIDQRGHQNPNIPSASVSPAFVANYEAHAVAGDYFRTVVYQDGGASMDICDTDAKRQTTSVTWHRNP